METLMEISQKLLKSLNNQRRSLQVKYRLIKRQKLRLFQFRILPKKLNKFKKVANSLCQLLTILLTKETKIQIFQPLTPLIISHLHFRTNTNNINCLKSIIKYLKTFITVFRFPQTHFSLNLISFSPLKLGVIINNKPRVTRQSQIKILTNCLPHSPMLSIRFIQIHSVNLLYLIR